MSDEINKALDGQLDADELKKFEAGLSEVAKAEYEKAKAFRKQRQDEERKLAEAQERTKGLEGQRKAEEEAQSKFRQEQFDKAKSKFFSTYKITEPADQKWYEDQWKKLGSGTVDPDNLYGELQGVYAFKNKDALLKAENEKREMEQNADRANAGAAGNHDSPPAPPTITKKYSPEAIQASKMWGIPIEKAQKRFDEAKKSSDPTSWREIDG